MNSRSGREGEDGPLSKQLAKCRDLLGRMMREERARFFLEPVDPEALMLPDYFDTIKQPMDFSTVQKKLQSDTYKDVHAYARDVRLVFGNAEEYNGSKSVVFRDSKFMRKLFESKFYSICGGEDPTKKKKKRKGTAQLSSESLASVLIVNLPTACAVCSKLIANQDPLHLGILQSSPTQIYCAACIAKGEQIIGAFQKRKLS